MELYTKTVSTLDFEKPTDDTVITGAKYSLNGGPLINLIVDDNTVKLPYFSSEGDLQVKWNFIIPGVGSYSDTQYHEIVTPYLTLAEIRKIYPTATVEEAATVEAAVRHVINAHTGQSFGYSEETIVVEGHGESGLRLPKRLITLDGFSTVNSVLNPHTAIIVSDGWYIKKGWTDQVTPIESDSLYWSGETIDSVEPGEPGYEKPSHGYIIVPPGGAGRPTTWKNDYPFTITGKWGYLSVPAPVKEAAKLLVNDYACKEQAFRDRYLESMKAADWRIQFNSRAWDATGNARADHLLSEYVLADWAVI